MTSQEKAEQAALVWRDRYYQCGAWSGTANAKEIYTKLAALNPVTPEAVVNIIGYSNWVYEECNICGMRVDRWLVLNGENHEKLHICGKCLMAAHKQMFPQ